MTCPDCDRREARIRDLKLALALTQEAAGVAREAIEQGRRRKEAA